MLPPTFCRQFLLRLSALVMNCRQGWGIAPLALSNSPLPPWGRGLGDGGFPYIHFRRHTKEPPCSKDLLTFCPWRRYGLQWRVLSGYITMNSMLLAVILLFLTSMAVLLIAMRRQPGPARWVAWGSVALVTAGWFLARQQILLPPAAGTENGLNDLQLLWRWRVDITAWQMSSWLLLLLLLAISAWREESEQTGAHLSLTLGLGLAGLLSLWAETPAALISSWALISGLWWAGLWLNSDAPARQDARLWLRLLALWGAVFSLWWGLAIAGANGRPSGWLLLAAVAPMGVFPFHGWRSAHGGQRVSWWALLLLAPAASGVSLLLRTAADAAAVAAYTLPLTGLGLLSLMAGGLLAWRELDDPWRLASALTIGQAGLVVLAAVWAGPAAALAEARVLLLACGLLLVASQMEHNLARLLAGTLATAALVAAPLLAGFAGRTALYDAWLADGRLLLLVVTPLLHVPLAAAALLGIGIWRAPATDEQRLSWPATGRPAFVAAQLGLLLPAAALLTTQGLAAAGWLSWLLALLPLGAGVFLSRHAGSALEIAQLVRQSLQLRLPWRAVYAGGRAVVESIGAALREAAGILESEGGMLWLLLFLILFWLARQG